jgi:hypothetical protein
MLTGWSEAAGLYCSWSNVVCDSMSNVVRLTLSYLGLEGGLPPAAVLLELPRLEVRAALDEGRRAVALALTKRRRCCVACSP